MSKADDMVVVPELATTQRAAAQLRARVERRLDAEHKAGGAVSKLRRARSRYVKTRASTKAGRRMMRSPARGVVGRAVGGTAVRVAAQTAGRAVIANPIGAAVAALTIAAVAAARLVHDEPFEGLAEDLNKAFFGDLDDEARAKMAVRKRMSGDQYLQLVAANAGQVTGQMASIARDLTELQKQYEIGAAALRREFPIDSTFEQLVLRIRDAVKEGLGESGIAKWAKALDWIFALSSLSGFSIKRKVQRAVAKTITKLFKYAMR